MSSCDTNTALPLVSVVITTCNGEKYLAEQLDSIINQTYKNLEIIILDDASSDKTPDIVKQYATSDKRIVSVFHTKNIGLHANLEAGLRISKGEYIAISDQDDIWLHEKIDLLLQNIGENLAIFSDSALIDENGASFNKTILDTLKIRNYKTCYKLLGLLRQNVVSGHAMFFNKALLTATLPFKKDIIFDHHLALVSAAYNSLAYYPTPLVLHRMHSANSVNSGLINKSRHHKIKQINRIEEKHLRVNRMLERFSLLLEIPKCQETNPVLFKKLAPVISELKKFDDVFFNFSLLIQLLQLRRQFPGFEIFTLRRCLSLAKGAKWYRFFDHFNSSIPSASIAPTDIKPDNYYSHLRPRMAVYLPANTKTCLDIGCGIGRFGQALKEGAPHLEIWGVEIMPAVAAQAKEKLDRVLVGDVLLLIDQLPDGYFDCIFFNDSLEHMIDPYSVLAAIKPKLKSNSGVIIASIPNIRHFSCLYNLLVKKDWRYVESGVMDSTHLRFFTQKSIRRMFEEANYNVEVLEGVSGSRKLRAKIWGWLTLGWMGDIRFKQFAVVAGIKLT